MSAEKPLVTFVEAEALNWVARSCLKSALRAGHSVHIYTYNDLENVPNGVAIKAAEEIIPRSEFFTFDGIAQIEQHGSAAPFSDVFRYELLSQSKGIWIDWDVYFIKPVICEPPFLIGWEGHRSWANALHPFRPMAGNALLWLPPDSPVLTALSDLTKYPYKMPPWLSRRLKAKIQAKLEGRPFFPGAARYAEFGPIALNYFVKKLRMQKFVSHYRHYYPVGYREVEEFLKDDTRFRSTLSTDTKTIHLWNSAFRRVANQHAPKGSFADRIKEESLDA